MYRSGTAGAGLVSKGQSALHTHGNLNNQTQMSDAAINMQKYMHSETKQSMTSFEQANMSGPQFQTLQKSGRKLISENGSYARMESVQEEEQQPMSNFSAQYRTFKNRNQAKSHERRRIKNVVAGARKNLISSDLYFHG